MYGNNNIKRKDMPKLKKEYRVEIRKKQVRILSWISVFMFSLIGTIYGVLKVYYWTDENSNMDHIMADITKQIEVKDEPVKPTNEEVLVNPPKDVINVTDDYWEYIKLPLINVNFDELKAKNADTKAFLKVSGTNINYPIVQAPDNEYYLDHSFDKSKNKAGWVFMDYRNSIEDLQDNTIVYAHGRQNRTMFGSLKDVLESNWYQNTENHVIYLSSEKENTLWQVFSVYAIPEETYYLTTEFGSEESHQTFIDTIKSRSLFNFNTEVNTEDKILTLSTCYNSINRVVLHAKLIKKQIKE